MSARDRWKHRRSMAWLALIGGLALPLIFLVSDSAQIAAFAASFYVFAGGVVASYIGFATVDDKNFKEPTNHESM